MISYLLPTRNRLDTLHRTLDALGSLSAAAHRRIGGAEVIVVDNASDQPVRFPDLPGVLDNGLPLRILHRETNEGAAARNIGAEHANGEWIIMLDDDSYPRNANHIEVLRNASDEVAAIGADITLPTGEREAGGLPEVIIGCGAAIRREAFLEVGGYDPSFDYYAEEYDLCAKLLLNGWRIEHDSRFRVRHEKITANRDMNRILHRLVRNNCWVVQRYAPPDVRERQIHETIERYGRIAMKENAARGFAQGVENLLQSLSAQPQRSMSPELYGRFTGLSHAREMFTVNEFLQTRPSVVIVDEGKNEVAIRQALHELDIAVINDERTAETLIVGTLSPGPMMDAFEKRIKDPATLGRPVIRAWSMNGATQSMCAVAA